MAEAVGQIETDRAPFDDRGDRCQDGALLRVGAPERDEPRHELAPGGPPQDTGQAIEQRLVDGGPLFRLEQRQAGLFLLALRRGMLDQCTPHAAAGAEHNDAVGLQMFGQRQTEEARPVHRAVREAIGRFAIAGLRVSLYAAEKGDERMHRHAPSAASAASAPATGASSRAGRSGRLAPTRPRISP
jgi:hypothetical protein